MYFFGWIVRLTPPAMAIRHSPLSKLSQAICTATIADEHIVSIAMLGPCRLKKYETRLAIEAGAVRATIDARSQSASSA